MQAGETQALRDRLIAIMITAFLMLLSTPRLTLPDFASAVFESPILQNCTSKQVSVGAATFLPGKISAHWWATKEGGKTTVIDVYLLLQPKGDDAKRALAKWANSGSWGVTNLEETPAQVSRPSTPKQGAVYRAGDDNVAAMAMLTCMHLDKADAAYAARLADQALELGEGFVHGRRAEARSIASRGAHVASCDPNLQLSSASRFPAYVSRSRDLSTNPRSSAPMVPRYRATVYDWVYVGESPYPAVESRLIVFTDLQHAKQVEKGLPIVEDGIESGPRVFLPGPSSHARIDPGTGKFVLVTTPPDSDPLIHFQEMGPVARSGKAVLFCNYVFSAPKPNAATYRALDRQRKKTLEVAGG